jgi:ADP-heptose:LPS heptosyltransferase
MSDHQNILNLTGKLTIPQLVYVLAKADLLIANETGTVHVAASTQTPTIVISQGKTLVRWHPYPDHLPQCIVHLYPCELEKNRYRFAELAPSLNPESPYSITEVNTDLVITTANQLLRKDFPTLH